MSLTDPISDPMGVLSAVVAPAGTPLKQLSWLPTNKVTFGSLSSIASAAVILLARKYLGLDVDADLASFIVVGVGSLVAYYVPPSIRDHLVPKQPDA